MTNKLIPARTKYKVTPRGPKYTRENTPLSGHNHIAIFYSDIQGHDKWGKNEGIPNTNYYLLPPL